MTLFNRLLRTNQAPSQVEVAKFYARLRLKLELLILRKKSVNFLPLDVPRYTFFKTFVIYSMK